MNDLSGTIIAGRFRVDQFLGRGGMADVYKVWDMERAAFLAMKLLHDDLAEDEIFLRRFRREAQTLAKLKHPNIVRFYEMGQDGELVFMLMEYVDGVTLSKARIRWGNALTPAQILGILQPVCYALHFAHQLQLIHCDIKPANIMIDRTGRPLLTDFGIARVSEGATTATMVGAGTPAYMSPEQVAGEDPTPQTDIYSLGVVLYELVTGGERPFTGERATITGTVGEKIRWEQRNTDPPSPRVHNPSITPELEHVILCCLAKDRSKRYSSVTELLEQLNTAVGAPPEPLPTLLLSREESRAKIAAPPAPVPPVVEIAPSEAPKARRRSFAGFWAIGGFVLALGLLFYGLSRGTPLLSAAPSNPTEPAASFQTPAPLIVPQTVEVTREIRLTSPPDVALTVPSRTAAPTAVADISLAQEHDAQGSYLTVQGGPENYDIRYGPISDGSYILAENNKFAAYVDVNGVVYVMNFRTTFPRPIRRLTKKDLQALGAHVTPVYSLSFQVDSNDSYVLVIHEREYGDIVYVTVPRTFSQ